MGPPQQVQKNRCLDELEHAMGRLADTRSILQYCGASANVLNKLDKARELIDECAADIVKFMES